MITVKQVQELHAKAQKIREAVVSLNYLLQQDLPTSSREDKVDIGFLMREMEDIFDELRKECKARKELIGRILCVQITEDPTGDMKLRGQLAIATPDVKMMPLVPKKGTPGYAALMAYLGVTDQEVIDRGLISFHFTHMTELVNERIAQGLNPPKELKLLPNPTCTFITKNRKSSK